MPNKDRVSLCFIQRLQRISVVVTQWIARIHCIQDYLGGNDYLASSWELSFFKEGRYMCGRHS